MTTWVETTPTGYRGRWRIGRKGPRGSRVFDTEGQARAWAEAMEADALQGAADLRAVTAAAHQIAGVDPARRGRGRPLAMPAPTGERTTGAALPQDTGTTTRQPTPPATPTPAPAEAVKVPTIGEYAWGWLRRQADLKEAGRSDYTTVLRHLDTWPVPSLGDRPLGTLPLDALTHDGVGDWRADQVNATTAAGDRRWGPRTINGRLAVLRAVLTAAVRAHLIEDNPTTGWRKLSERARRPHRALTPAEVAALSAAATAEERIWLGLGLLVGMRWGEVFGLATPAVVRTPTGSVRVRVRQVNQAKTATLRKASTKTGDTEAAMRWVPVPPEFAALLWAHVEAVRATRGDTTDSLLFATSTGTPVLYRNWERRAWKPLLRRAGLVATDDRPLPQFHDLRHTWATSMGRRGADLWNLMAMGGWRKVETVRKYVHADDLEDQDDLAARVFGRTEAHGFHGLTPLPVSPPAA